MSGADAIKVGDVVSKTSDPTTVGRVQFIKDGNAYVGESYDKTEVIPVSGLTKVGEGLGAIISTPGVSFSEVAQNGVAYAAINRVVSKKWWDSSVRNFIVADVAAEVYVSQLLASYGILAFKLEDMEPITGDDLTSYLPGTTSLKMAANKTVHLAIIDTALRFFMKQTQTKGRVVDILKQFGALVGGNMIERQMQKPTGRSPSYYPR